MTATTDKPKQPIGLRPRWIAETPRILEIVEAMQRYAAANKRIPDDWIAELQELSARRPGYVRPATD